MQKWFINIEVITAKKQMHIFALPISIEGEEKRANKSRDRSTKINHIFIDIPKNKCYNEKAK